MSVQNSKHGRSKTARESWWTWHGRLQTGLDVMQTVRSRANWAEKLVADQDRAREWASRAKRAADRTQQLADAVREWGTEMTKRAREIAVNHTPYYRKDQWEQITEAWRQAVESMPQTKPGMPQTKPGMPQILHGRLQTGCRRLERDEPGSHHYRFVLESMCNGQCDIKGGHS